MEEHAVDIVRILWIILGAIIALGMPVFGWFLKREVNIVTDKFGELAGRVEKVETEVQGIKTNYLSRFEAMNKCVSDMRLEVMEKLHQIEKLILQKHKGR